MNQKEIEEYLIFLKSICKHQGKDKGYAITDPKGCAKCPLVSYCFFCIGVQDFNKEEFDAMIIDNFEDFKSLYRGKELSDEEFLNKLLGLFYFFEKKSNFCFSIEGKCWECTYFRFRIINVGEEDLKW